MPNVQKQKILRVLGTAERWFWLMNQNRPLHFLLAASFHGTRSEEQWHEAIDTAGARHPTLRLGVAQMDNEFVFVKADPRIAFRCVTRKNGSALEVCVRRGNECSIHTGEFRTTARDASPERRQMRPHSLLSSLYIVRCQESMR
jgi:hypothetical protein